MESAVLDLGECGYATCPRVLDLLVTGDVESDRHHHHVQIGERRLDDRGANDHAAQIHLNDRELTEVDREDVRRAR